MGRERGGEFILNSNKVPFRIGREMGRERGG